MRTIFEETGGTYSKTGGHQAPDLSIEETQSIGKYANSNQLPPTLCANDVAAFLHISRANAYTLLHREDFPTLQIGKRLLTPRNRFLQWIEDNTR